MKHIIENIILHEIFRVVSRFPRYISCYIAENRFPLGQFSKSALGALIDNYSFYHEKNRLILSDPPYHPLVIGQLFYRPPVVDCVTVHL